MKQWTVAPLDKQLAKRIAETYELPSFLAMMLAIRGISGEEQINDFLNASKKCFDPFLLTDMEQAVERIHRAVDSFEKICVYGDYDADGVTSTTLLYSYLQSCGADVLYYIPQREDEGYGMNLAAVDKLHEYGVRLIVTVDNGIASLQEIEYANSLGIDTVITDHHQQQGDVLPPAVAIVNPHRKDSACPFKQLAGVGVTFQLIAALEGEEMDFSTLLDNYADLVAIGTIGDIVPLVRDNRILVQSGLTQLAHTDRLGVQAILEEAGLENNKLTSTSIAFTVVPRINAAGRLGSSDQAVKLLLSEYPEEAKALAEEISAQNRERQQIELEIIHEIEQALLDMPERRLDRVLVVDGERWHSGVVGIVASRLVESYGKPCIVISRDGEEARGSGRSVEGFSLSDAIFACSGLLTRYGGHPMAAGISLKAENVAAFREAINQYAVKSGEMPHLKLHIDCKLRPQALTLDMVEQLSLLEPFGTGNPAPLFGLYQMELVNIYPCGNNKHLRLTFQRDQAKITAMKFSVTPEEFPYQIGDVLDLAVTIEKNVYRGEESLSIHIRDYKLHGVEESALLHEYDLYEQMKRGEPVLREELAGLLPTRSEFAVVYRFLREHKGWSHGLDVLWFRLRESGIKFGKLAVILDIMDELRLIGLAVSGSRYAITLNDVGGKVNLESSYILSGLKQAAAGGDKRDD